MFAFVYLVLAVFKTVHAQCPANLPVLQELSCSDVITTDLNLKKSSYLRNYSGKSGHRCTLNQPNAEELYAFDCKRSGEIKLLLHDLTCDLDIYVLDDSCKPNGGCIKQSIAANSDQDSIKFSCQEGERYYIVIEDFACSGQSAHYQLSFDTRAGTGCEENCTDGVDNDLDGDVDCDDSFCYEQPECSKPWGPKCAQKINGMYPDALSEQNIAIGEKVHLNVPILTDASTDSIVATYKGQTLALQSQGNTYTGSLNLQTSEPVEIEIRAKKDGESDKVCYQKVNFLPWVDLQSTTGHEGTVGPATLDNVLNPFSAVPVDLDTQDRIDPLKVCRVDGCGGSIVTVDLSTTKSQKPFQGYVTLDANSSVDTENGIPWGIRYYQIPTAIDLTHVSTEDAKEYRKFIRQMEFELGQSVGFEYHPDDPRTHQFQFAVCNQGCPAGKQLTLNGTVSVDNIFVKEGPTISSQPTSVQRSFTETIEIGASSFWTCHAGKVEFVVWLITTIFWLRGFIVPFRFPKQGQSSRAPSYFTPLALGSLHKPDYKPTILAIDSYAPKRTWYRHESVYINDDTMMLSKEEKSSCQAAIILRDKPERKGQMQVWFDPKGQKWIRARFIPGSGLGGYKGQFESVPAEGEELKLDSLYICNIQSKPDWGIVFKR